MLSGHSRLEGMKRRKARTIPARFFEGTEQEAITFARVDAKRSANVENIIEDLKALKIYTDPEKEAIQKLGQKLKEEQSRIKRDLKVSEQAPGLFGFGNWRLKSTDFDFSKFLLKMRKLKITKEMFIDVIYNPNTVIFYADVDFDFVQAEIKKFLE